MSVPVSYAHRDELRNICENYPVFAGKTISHQTARDLSDWGWIERNANGDWIPTSAGLKQYAEYLGDGVYQS